LGKGGKKKGGKKGVWLGDLSNSGKRKKGEGEKRTSFSQEREERSKKFLFLGRSGTITSSGGGKRERGEHQAAP